MKPLFYSCFSFAFSKCLRFQAAGLVLALGSTAWLPAMAQTVPLVVQTTLSNGMTLIVQPDRRAPTAVHMLWVRAGSMDETDGTTGVAHVLEHMLFKGTALQKPGDFSRQVAALGGRENAFTSRDATGYHQQIPASQLETVMRLEADRFAGNQWADEEFVREIEVVKEERRARTEDSVQSRMFEQAQATVFVASPYRRPIVGWMNDLESMTPQDVRDFYRRWYAPGNAAIVVAGDVDVRQVQQWAEKYYGVIAARPVPQRKPQTEPVQSGIKRLDFKGVSSQAAVAMFFKTPSLAPADLHRFVPDNRALPDLLTLGTSNTSQRRAEFAPSPTAAASRDALSLVMLSMVLSDSSSARLNRALVQGSDGSTSGSLEAGQRIAIRASAASGLIGRGPQLFVLEGVPILHRNTQLLADALRRQVAIIATSGVSDAELTRIKIQWIASETYKLDSVYSQASELGSNWVQGLPMDASARLVQLLLDITSADVQAAAGKYFGDDQMTMAVLMPQAPDPNAQPRPPAAAAGTSRHGVAP